MKEEVTTKQYDQTYTTILRNKCGNHVQKGIVCGNKYCLQYRKYKKHKTRYNNHIDQFILKKTHFKFQIRIKFIQKQSLSD